MDQPQGKSRLDRGVVDGSAGDRDVERRPAVEQMMAEIREGLGMQVLAIMVQRYRVLPKELWDLNRVSDMGAERRIAYNDKLSKAMYERIISITRYSIVTLTIRKDVSHKVSLPRTLRQLTIRAFDCKLRFNLPPTLQELTFESYCRYSLPLQLPQSLRKLKLSNRYNLQITFPSESELLELELGSSYNRPLILPPRLKRLAFEHSSSYNFPLALPPRLVDLQLGRSYNQPTVLPPGIKELRVGEAFTHDLSLPDSLRKIVWCCNRPIQIPEGVFEVEFSNPFNMPVTLPASLKKATFGAGTCTHPITFPAGLEDLAWLVKHYDGLVLPEGLRKLDWASCSNVQLPSGLRELTINRPRVIPPLVLPAGLLKVNFCRSFHHVYALPESVQEVYWSIATAERIFTHPTTLQHLIVNGQGKIDLSDNTIYKLTIEDSRVEIKAFPRGLKTLAFTVDVMYAPLRVPKGCRIVGGKQPKNVTME